MNNLQIARLLRQVSAAYLLTGENRFKIIAYERAADSIEKSIVDVADLWRSNKLNTLPGVGCSIASYIDELFRKGKVKHFNEVLSKLPKSIFPLMDVPGFGPKKAYKLVTELKLRNPDTAADDLLKAAKQGKIASIEKFGIKSQQDIIEALKGFKEGKVKKNRIPLSFAYSTALPAVEYLKKHKASLQVALLGSLRRKKDTVGDIDIAVATKDPQAVVNWFVDYPKRAKTVEKGPSGASILLTNGQQIDLRVQRPESFGCMLQYFTGSKNHNIHLREYALKKGLSLSEYGVKLLNTPQNSKLKTQNYNKKNKIYEYSSEKEFYEDLGMAWIPPELREDTGEIEAALRQIRQTHVKQVQGKQPGLPPLINNRDIKGDLHIHSNYDLEPSHDLGESSPQEILARAVKSGYEYVGISDHNPSYTNHSEQEIISILKRRRSYFEQILMATKSVRVNLFIMLEVDILPDGTLPIPKEAFEYLDAIIVSIHSSFKMPKDQMTKRIISGLSYPKAKILGHPTGRMIGRREGYEADWPAIFSFCHKNKRAVEINSHPIRLDLPDILVRQAIENGVKLVVDSDSHEASQMELVKFGVSVARRGWATKDDIMNSLSYNEIKEWLFS